MRVRDGFLPWAAAVLAAAELALLGGWLATGAAVLALLVQTLLVAGAVLAVVWDRYLRIRRRQWAEYARSERMRERARLAEDLHDLIGHELSLLAIRAGAVQVHSSGAEAEEAAALRADAQRAVLQLRQTVVLLGDDRTAASASPPAAADIPALVARARGAGLEVELHGDSDAGLPAPVRLTAHRVVQEGLTNALRHAPQTRAEVRIRVRGDRAEIAVSAGAGGDGGDGGAPGGGGTGLAGLRRRVEAIGGAFEAGDRDGRHLVRAELPLGEPATAAPGAGDEPGPRPRPLAATLRWALLPTLVMAVLTAGFHLWATHGSTLETADFQRISPGQPYDRVRPLLPAREAPMRFAVGVPEPPGARCVHFTDGNFPLGLASFRICHDGASVVEITDLRRVPLW
ncbi:sensor histidine kinase [Streptomonospora sp. PA3]|uniref:sensor histidine kinase n=1 Tax=Streptomonospora sp. PA3 TaxID=2607326 RepID=UPI0016425249|nr:histidine kinase [Streptomonospora sp. PA3]